MMSILDAETRQQFCIKSGSYTHANRKLRQQDAAEVLYTSGMKDFKMDARVRLARSYHHL